MGYRALGSFDQREVVDCAMGEGPYTIKIYVKNTCKKCRGVQGKGELYEILFHYGKRGVNRGRNLVPYPHTLRSFNTRILPQSVTES